MSKDERTVFAIVLTWPKWGIVNLAAPNVGPETKITVIGYDLEDIEVSFIKMEC